MSSAITNFFKIGVKKPTCIKGLSEDDLRELVNALLITVTDPTFPGFVRSTNGTDVKFEFDGNGNFAGVSAKLDSKNVFIISGAGGQELGLFKGSPSAANPGPGWRVEIELTRKFFNQNPELESQWEIFVASRIGVLNTLE